MTMFPSACIWNYRNDRMPVVEVLRQIKQTAFHYIDVEPDTLEPPGALQALKDLGLKVSCVALDHEMPDAASLEGQDPGTTRAAIEHLKRALKKSHRLGATVAYVAPCTNRKYLRAFGKAFAELAGEAADKEIRLCVEHVPGRALATAKEALAFLAELKHPNAYFLLDIGHALLSNEKPWEAVVAAGKRLGYVQMNDNDGKKDRHWPLLDGRLTYVDLAKTIEALQQVGYQGTLGLELNRDFASLISGFSRNRNLLLRLQAEAGPTT